MAEDLDKTIIITDNTLPNTDDEPGTAAGTGKASTKPPVKDSPHTESPESASFNFDSPEAESPESASFNFDSPEKESPDAASPDAASFDITSPEPSEPESGKPETSEPDLPDFPAEPDAPATSEPGTSEPADPFAEPDLPDFPAEPGAGEPGTGEPDLPNDDDFGGSDEPPNSGGSGGLRDIGDLLKDSFGIFKSRALTLIGLYILSFIFMLIPIAIFGAIGWLLYPMLSGMTSIIVMVSVCALLGISIGTWAYSWGLTALITAVCNEDMDIKEALGESKSKATGFLWLWSLWTLVVMGGFLFFLIPGILLTIWLMPVLYIFIGEDTRGMDVLLKSKEYVRGHWKAIFLRLFIMFILLVIISLIGAIIANIIPLFDLLINLILIPFYFIYTFLIYEDLRATKGDIPVPDTPKTKYAFIALSLIGCLPLLAIPAAIAIPQFAKYRDAAMMDMGEEIVFDEDFLDTKDMADFNIIIEDSAKGTKIKITPPVKKTVEVKVKPKKVETARPAPSTKRAPEIKKTPVAKVVKKEAAPIVKKAPPVKVAKKASTPIKKPKAKAASKVTPTPSVALANTPYWLRDIPPVAKDIATLSDMDAPWLKRNEAARRLGHSKDQAAVKPLLEALRNDPEPFVRREAALALKAIDGAEAGEALKTALTDNNEWVRKYAEEALGIVSPEIRATHKPWAINIASIGSKAEAERVRSLLTNAGHEVEITTRELGEKTLHRLRIGYFSTKAEALKAKESISQSFDIPKLWIIKTEGEK